MKINKQLQNYIEKPIFRDALEIPSNKSIELLPLAQGEYNMNYTFSHPVTGQKMVFRVNTGSQMHLPNQIEYEHHALKLLEQSGRTPKPFYVDGNKNYLDHGVMVIEFLEGKPLVYEKDLSIAAEILADIHSVPLEKECGLIDPGEPLQAILDECQDMVKTYYDSPLGETKIKKQIEKMLHIGQKAVDQCDYDQGYRCCINTELNSGNFLINGKGRSNYLVDWEKPLYGEVAQDLGHFLAPTTTFWKTDTILTYKECAAFVKQYSKCVNGRFDVSELQNRVDLFIPITCLRGITWCAMAWVEYQTPGRMLRNEDTFQKIDAYLQKPFLDMIESNYLNF